MHGISVLFFNAMCLSVKCTSLQDHQQLHQSDRDTTRDHYTSVSVSYLSQWNFNTLHIFAKIANAVIYKTKIKNNFTYFVSCGMPHVEKAH